MKTQDIKFLQSALGVDADSQLGPITRTAYANRLIQIGKKYIGIHETSKNHGDGIAQFWTAVDYNEGYIERQPYCAAFISFVVQQSKMFSDKNRPKTAAAFGFEKWGEKVGMIVDSSPKIIKKGDLVIFRFSHIGLATSDSDFNGIFSTIEANTGSAGERDGDGVYAKSRHIATVRSVVRL